MSHNFRTTLYHGTVSEIQYIDVHLGRGRKDFGKGFYMAVSKNQAVGMMHKKFKEVVSGNFNRESYNETSSDWTDSGR